jgi:hypothetical protein
MSWLPVHYGWQECVAVFCPADVGTSRVCDQCTRTQTAYCGFARATCENSALCFWNATSAACFELGTTRSPVTAAMRACSACRGYWSGGSCNTCDAPTGANCSSSGGAIGCDGRETQFGQAGIRVVDKCGVCGGGDACYGCDGVLGSNAKLDKCGVCGGTGVCTKANQAISIKYMVGAKGTTSAAESGAAQYGGMLLDPTFDFSKSETQWAINDVCEAVHRQTTGDNTKALLTTCIVRDFKVWVARTAVRAAYNLSFVSAFPVVHTDKYWASFLLFKYAEEAQRLSEVAFTTSNSSDRENFRVAFVTFSLDAQYDHGEDYTQLLFLKRRFDVLTQSMSVAMKTSVVMAADRWVSLATEQQSRSGIAWAIALGFFMFMALVHIMTCSVAMTAAALLSVGGTVLVAMSFFTALDYRLGAVEQLGASLLLGFSAEHAIHFVVAYLDVVQGSQSHLFARETTRLQAFRGALTKTGAAIVSSTLAVTLAAVLYLWSDVLVFRRAASISIIAVCVSMVFSLVFLGAFTCVMAPIATYRLGTIMATLTFIWLCVAVIAVIAMAIAGTQRPDGAPAVPT